jgi:uncharacterized protein (DUF302 family)
MSYFEKTIEQGIEATLGRVMESVKGKRLGVLSEIDVPATLMKKRDVDFRLYRMLGACNPPFGCRNLSAEDKIGTKMPRSVVVQEAPPGRMKVAAIDPVGSMQAVPNSALSSIAGKIGDKLARVASLDADS